jgi:protocatechuate 3,4-dioxygenase alpha subunit
VAKLAQTPSQTVGPYFAYGLTPEQYGYNQRRLADGKVSTADDKGERIRIEGRVLDGEGNPITDAMIEIWQADGEGRYAHPADPRRSNTAFTGFGRFGTGADPSNRFIFETVKPASIDGRHAPHINVTVFMRGMLLHAYTRIYFAEESALNEKDPVMQSVPPNRRGTLLAQRAQSAAEVLYRWDIHMQGEAETVFFDA